VEKINKLTILKSKTMSVLKEKCQVIMLLTKEKAIDSNNIILLNPITGKCHTPKHPFTYPVKEYKAVGYKTFYLYFLSNDEIKDNDWFLQRGHRIKQCKNDSKAANKLESCKKIIATTDSSLKKPSGEIYPEWNYVPQPSQEFIEKYIKLYNQGNTIIDVLVEYKIGKCNCRTGGIFDGCINEFNTCKNSILKINPKDNTLTIHPIKDSWNREEVIELCKKAYDDGFHQGTLRDSPCKDNSFWIEENL
jgi:hypothetical protein